MAHSAADRVIQGDIWTASFWSELRAELDASVKTPAVFVHALSGFQSVVGLTNGPNDGLLTATLLSADLGGTYLIPAMPVDRGAVVFITSVLAGWDTRAEAGLFGASQAALLALARSQALLGAPSGIRGNAVSVGLLEDLEDGGEVDPSEIRGRIPLGRLASPADADCAETPGDHPLTGLLLTVAQSFGAQSEMEGMSSHTDMGLLVNADIPTVNFGPGEPSVAHQPDEHVRERDLLAATRTLALTTAEWCGWDRASYVQCSSSEIEFAGHPVMHPKDGWRQSST